MKAAVATKDLDASATIQPKESVMSKSRPAHGVEAQESRISLLTRDQLLDIMRILVDEVCRLDFRRRGCRCRLEVREVVQQIGLCDREDLDKQDEEMRKRKAKTSKSRGGGFSVYFVPCYCHTCGHRCSNIYGPYFKVRTAGGTMNMNLDLQSPEVQEKVRQATQAYRRSHPSALLPGDPGWTSHKHSHSEKDLDTHSRMDRKPLVSKSQARG